MLKSALRSRESRLRRGQRGLSLVEMMVGVAIGLFIVAGATVLAASQLAENRRLLLETQVQQDLRAALDIITRELRRAGHDSLPARLVWSAQAPQAQPLRNLWGGLQVPGQNTDVVSYQYDREGAGGYVFGYRLTPGVSGSTVKDTISQRLGDTLQALTDRNTLRITHFSVTINQDSAGNDNVPALKLACPRLCPTSPPSQSCWPTLKLVDAVVKITGESATDAAVSRSVVSRVRLRNDAVKFNMLLPTQVCP